MRSEKSKIHRILLIDMKDPAILWYWDDWGGGTMLLTRHQKGCYMDLLNAQFNNGHLSLEEIKICLGADFGPQWPTLQKKFKTDEQGLYYNERMDIEIVKRGKYKSIQSQHGKKGAAKRWGKKGDPNSDPINYPNSKNITIGNGNRNGVEEKGGMGEKETHIIPKMQQIWLKHFPDYLDLTETDFPALLKIIQFICKHDHKKFDIDGGREFILRRWGEICAFCAGDGHYSTYSIERVAKHFQSLIQAKIKHESNTKRDSKGGKLGGFNRLTEQLKKDFEVATGSGERSPGG